MEFLILRVLTHSELGMFHEYRRQGKEGSKQRAVNFDGPAVARVFPAASRQDRIEMDLRSLADTGPVTVRQWLRRQGKNWRLEGHCPRDTRYAFVAPGCLFAMSIDAGVTPATGSWAVFPADADVTRAVLADPGSRGLDTAGMIALHGREGSHLLPLLATAAPDLFAFPETMETPMNESPPDAPEEAVDGGVRLPPRGVRLTDALSDVGHTMPSAVAELVDNAITAGAGQVDIRFDRPDDGHGRWMTIADDGHGMDWTELKEAMRLGSDRTYGPGSLGKYGYGLKGASWSQAGLLTVVSQRAGGTPRHLTWDKASMDDEWIASTAPLQPWAEEITRIDDHGTVVLWRDMPPPLVAPAAGLETTPYQNEIRDLDRHLALVFHRFIEGLVPGRPPVVIRINGVPVQANNPVGHRLVRGYDARTVHLPTANGTGTAPVEVRGYLLPSEEELKQHHAAEGPTAAEKAIDRIGLHGRRTETQGLFIYRNNRLIRWGGWYDMWSTTDEKTKLARMTVDFTSDLDKAFGINISKQIVRPPAFLQTNIKPLAKFVRNDSQAKFRKKAPAAAPVGTPGPAASPTTAVPTGGTPAPTPTPATPAAPTPTPAAPPAPAPPRVTLRPVATPDFVWRISESLGGGQELLVSDQDADLSELARLIATHPQATLHLARFLGRLQDAGAHELITTPQDA